MKNPTMKEFLKEVEKEVTSWPAWKRVNMGLTDRDRQTNRVNPDFRANKKGEK